jgi:hypothetical protein
MAATFRPGWSHAIRAGTWRRCASRRLGSRPRRCTSCATTARESAKPWCAGGRRSRGPARRVCGDINLEDGQIGAGVGAGERCRHGGPVGQSHGDLLLAADGVFGGDDRAGAPEYAARREPRPGMHCNHIAPGQFDSGRDLIGKGGQFVCHVITGSRGTQRHAIGRSSRRRLPDRPAFVARVGAGPPGNCYKTTMDEARRRSPNGRIIGSVRVEGSCNSGHLPL